MPVTCTTTALADASACFVCISPQINRAIQILLLCNTINGVTMTCTSEALANAAIASGFDQPSPQQQNAIILLLMCTLANSGGGGGGGSVEIYTYSGSPPPTDPPDNPLAAAISYSEDGSGPTFFWNISTQAWM